MDVFKCKGSIEKAISELNNCIGCDPLNIDEWTLKIINKVLKSMKEEVDEKNQFGDRIIRGFKDVVVISSRNYEHSKLGDAINELSSCLNLTIPNYREYEPLGMDFGKQNPF